MSGYEEFEKIFGGKWKWDRYENMNEFMDNMGKIDDHKKFVLSLKPTVTFTRQGDSIHQNYEFELGYSVESTIKFGQEHETKDKNDPMKFHNMTMPTFDGTTFRQEVKSVLPQEGNYVSLGTVTGDELTLAMHKEGDSSVIGKTIYKRV